MENIIIILNEKWLDLNWFLFIGVFVAYFIVDWAYAVYTIAAGKLQTFRSANFGTLIYVLGALGVLSYSENFLYVIPLAIGAWLGTVFAIEIEKRKIKKKRNRF
jgi:uncharacterized protein YebE (UPF0316 family)